MSWPLTIWNCAAVSGSPRIASDTVPATSDRRYLWKLGSSCLPLLNKLKVCARSPLTTARMKALPAMRVGMLPGAEAVVVGGLPPLGALGALVAGGAAVP